METNSVLRSAAIQLRNWVKKNKKQATVHVSKMKKNLIYVDFDFSFPIEKDQMEKISKKFNKELNPHDITVEVRKNWF